MKQIITRCEQVSEIEQVIGSWEAQSNRDWALTILTPPGGRIPSAPRGVAVIESSRPFLIDVAEQSRRASTLWLLAPGRYLETGAVASVDHWLEQRPATDVLYGDSAHVGGSRSIRPRYGKVRMLSSGDMGTSVIVRDAVAHNVLSELDTGSTWYDLVVSLCGATEFIEHVPVILDTGSIPEPVSAIDKAQSLPGSITIPGHDYVVPSGPLGDESISIVIPSIGSAADFDGLSQPALLPCLDSIFARNTSRIAQIIIVAGPAMPEDVIDAARERAGDLLTIVEIDGPFNFSASCNLGAAHATGSHILFLNDDVEVVTDEWLETLLGVSALPHVGAVGARLLFPDGTIQHAGITVRPDSSEPNHLYYRLDPATVADPSAACTSEFLAVTGACLLVATTSFEQVGGFRMELPANYNDVDLCLKLGTQGLASVSCNQVTLIHRESTSRVPTITDVEEAAMAAWQPYVGHDLYWYSWS